MCWLPVTPAPRILSSARLLPDAVVQNFILHAFPVRVTKRALGFLATGWLGTITLHIFVVLCLTGGVLMFLL